MYRTLLILVWLLGCVVHGMAQEEVLYGQDTLRYTYTPLAPITADSIARRPNFLQRVVNYFGESTVDRSYEKKIDITFAGGPSYSKTTSLGLGVLAAGLYRLDRTDSITPPSDVTLYGSVAISGYFTIGITGNTIFRNSRHKLDYDLAFSSSPRNIWGIGYEAGCHNPETEILEQRYNFRARYLHRFLYGSYVGVVLDFDHTNGDKMDEVALAYIGYQKRHYTATGLGLVLEYDTRDFIPNPSKGLYFSVQELFYAKGLGNCDKSLWRTLIRVNAYHRVWKDALLAYDLYGEFNSQGTPWSMLARMGDSERMRGYYTGRYTDNNLLTMQVELRQHIWRRIGGVAWVGAGNVFPEISRMRLDETLPNYGLGLRWELKKRVNVRFDYGFGRDTSGFLLSINEAF